MLAPPPELLQFLPEDLKDFRVDECTRVSVHEHQRLPLQSLPEDLKGLELELLSVLPCRLSSVPDASGVCAVPSEPLEYHVPVHLRPIPLDGDVSLVPTDCTGKMSC